jgi:hypothetical protein
MVDMATRQTFQPPKLMSASDFKAVIDYTGKLSCFVAGISTFFPRSIANERQICPALI